MNCFLANTGKHHHWATFKAGDAVEVEYYVDEFNGKAINRVRNIKAAAKPAKAPETAAAKAVPAGVMPVGVLVYVHEELTERVPFMSEAALFDAFKASLESGFPIEHLWPYVSEGHMDLVDRLFLYMDQAIKERYSIYQLHEYNLQEVLGDCTVTVGPAA